MRDEFGLIVGFCLMLFSASASAHDPKAGSGTPKHGGQYVEYQTHFGVELVSGPDQLTFHMTEHLLPKDMADSDFKIFVQSEGATKTLKPVPTGETLVVALEKALPAGTKIVLTGKDSDDQTIQARFVTK